MAIFIADGMRPQVNNLSQSPIGQDHVQFINMASKVVLASSSANQAVTIVEKQFLDVARFGDFLMGNAQVLVTIVAVGFSVYVFVLGMNVSRLALRLILKQEDVVRKFSFSLVFVGILAALSILPYKDYPFFVVLILFVATIIAYGLPVYWLILLCKKISSYSSPNSIMKLIKSGLMGAIESGYEVETGQLKKQRAFELACEKAGIELIPMYASLYDGDNQISVRPNKGGYINGFDPGKLERIGQLIKPVVTSETVTGSTPQELRERQKNKVRIFQTIGSFIDPESINQSLNTVASIDKSAQDSREIEKLFQSLFYVSSRNKFATEINDLLIDLKNHILEIIKNRNLDEYESNILIFPELLKKHYKQSKSEANRQSLSYLNPIREIIAELLENTLQIKSPAWSSQTVSLINAMLSLAIENNDKELFKQFVTLFLTLYNLSQQLNLKDGLRTSHHLLYELLNYHLIPKLERELKHTEKMEDRKALIDNAKTFIWSIFVILSENLKRAYQANDLSYTNSVIRMLKGSLRFLGEYDDVSELVELKDWYNKSLIRLWLNQLSFAFILGDKKDKWSKEIFQTLIAATKEYTLEEISFLAVSDKNKTEGLNFPDFLDVMYDEESEYTGSGVFMGDPYTSKFRAYVSTAISRDSLNGQKSIPISQYYFDELKKNIEVFKSDSYKKLLQAPQETILIAFNEINESARSEYVTETEQSIIDASLDEGLISRFKENVLRGWKENSSIRFLLKQKVIKQLDECPDPSGEIGLHGFNQRHSKEYFIIQERFGYPKEYGYEYGKALSEGEDLVVYEKLLTAANPKPFNVQDKSAEQIINALLEEVEPKKDTIMFIPFDFWEFQYRYSKNFVPKYSLSSDDKLKDLRGLIGYYKYNGLKIPMIYSPERKRRQDKLVLTNIRNVGRMTIFKPHPDSQHGIEVYADIKLLSEADIQHVIEANPSDLQGQTEEAKKRKLSQEVALKVLERYSFEVTNSSRVHIFKLEGIAGS